MVIEITIKEIKNIKSEVNELKKALDLQRRFLKFRIYRGRESGRREEKLEEKV